MRLYNIVWMFVLRGVRVATERFADYRTTRHAKSVVLINQALHRTAVAAAKVA